MERRDEDRQRKIAELIERGVNAMTPKEARNIIESMVPRGSTFYIAEDRLGGFRAPLVVPASDGKITLDGEFTADQLEAIATWMRDPKGVAEA